MMFKKKPRFRIVMVADGWFAVQEWQPWWKWPLDGYMTKSYKDTLDQAERVVERLARADAVVAEYDYPPLVKRG